MSTYQQEEGAPLRPTEIDARAPEYKELSKDWLAQQTQKYDPDGYEEVKNKSGHPWLNLPESVMGTLVYFMLVEQNGPHMHFLSFCKAYLVIGFPTVLCYFFQFVMIRGLWLAVYGDGGSDDASANIIADFICTIDSNLLFSAVGVYIISMIPAFEDWINLTDIILNSQRVAYTQDANDDKNPKIFITNLLAPMSRRILIFVTVNFLEGLIILALSYVGIGFLLSSDDVQDVLMNSVAVAFIADIDDMARGAYQTDQIDEQIDGMEFESPSFSVVKEDESDMSSEGVIRTPGVTTYKTFSFAKHAIVTIILAAVFTFIPIYHYCH